MLEAVWEHAKRAVKPTGAPRVLIASNRLPVTGVKEFGKIRFRPSDGGLAAGLRQVARRWPVRWYGWSGLASDTFDVQPIEHSEASSLIGIPLSSDEVTGYYTDYSNSVLWPALHGLTVEVESRPDAWQRYVDVNSRFAAAIRADVRPTDRIWIHDYHLLLLPQLLRRRSSDGGIPIVFFLHTPFPAAEEFKAIPHHRALLEGVLGSDVIGFHTEEYASEFLRTAAGCGYDVRDGCVLTGGRRVQVRVRPMGIDAELFARLGRDPSVLEEVTRLRSVKRVLFLGVDRLDYTKGIPQRLLAFESMLEDRPELHGKVSLLQIAVPSRTENTAYADLRDVVEQLVQRINRRYGNSGWTPVEYLYDTVDLHTLASLYRAADVMLVTPCRDGLNLVAKEFVATRVDGDGVLILSKYAGAAVELDAALKCDPNRIKELAQTYYRAVTMPLEERRQRMANLMRSVMKSGITSWISYFIGEPQPTEVGLT